MQWEKRISLFGFVLFILIAVTAIILLIPGKFSSTPINYYDRYADALKNGRLWISEASTRELCPWDSSFFQGKCYLYWGIPPAIFHLAFRFISDRVWTVLASGVATFFLLRILLTIRNRKADRDESRALVISICFLVVINSGLLPVAVTGRVYDEAVAFSHAFGLAGVYFALPILFASTERRFHTRAVLSGSLFGLAFLTRFLWLITGLLMFAIGFLFNKPRSIRALILSLTPVLFCVMLQASLNYVRFGNWTEFGFRFQRMNWERFPPDGRPRLSLKRLGLNLTSYCFTGRPRPTDPQIQVEDLRVSPALMWLIRKTPVRKEFPLALSLAIPNLWLLVFQLKKVTFRTFHPNLKLALVFFPVALSIADSPSQIFRYDSEVYFPFIFLLVPLLISSQRRDNFCDRIQFVLVLLGTGIGLFHLYWVVKNVCYNWHAC